MSIITKKTTKPIPKADDNPDWWLKFVPETSHWTDLNILRFMRLYQSHPLLWDKCHLSYKDRRARSSAYRDIARTLKLANVGAKECTKLVELLKKRYLEAQEFGCASANESRPAWFDIVRNIINRILNPEIIEESPSFEACKDCCAKQNLTAPCCHYDSPSQKSSSTIRDCRDCCANQNLEPPCEYYHAPGKSISSSSDSCPECKDLDPPCECHDNPDKAEEIKCFTVTPSEVKLILINFARPYKDEDADDEVCDCSERSSTSGSDSSLKIDNGDQSCSCTASKSLSKRSNTPSSSFDKKDYCIKDFTICDDGPNNALRLLPGTDVACNAEDGSDADASSELGDVAIANTEGLFVESTRFRGKRISLVDAQRRYDYFDGREEISEPRRHFATCADDRGHEVYPLQLEI